MMHHIGISIENISTDASSNSQWASEEGSYATLILIGIFDAFTGKSEGLYDPYCDIVLVLGKGEE